MSSSLNEKRRHQDPHFDAQPVPAATLADRSRLRFEEDYLRSAFDADLHPELVCGRRTMATDCVAKCHEITLQWQAMVSDKESIRRRSLDLTASGGRGVAAGLATEFGLSRQVANGYLQTMVREGLLEAEGTTRARKYRLKTLTELVRSYPREGLQEDVVAREAIAPVVKPFAQSVCDIWDYASTEMINNAIDHSGTPEVRVSLRQNALYTEVVVADEGEGIFLKIQRAFGLHDAREAILELAKGKLTTAPEKHTGQGIFFTSRALDLFEIESHRLRFNHSSSGNDSIAEQQEDTPGTRVRMRLANDSPRLLREVFDAFSDPEEYTFDKTVVPLRLAQYESEKLVSRSQAKRVSHRFERFKRVELDFAGVSEIGQAFADQLFRVFAAAHPAVRIVPINTTPAVAHMIRRAMAAGSTESEPGAQS